MTPLPLHEFHQGLGARFAGLDGAEIVNDYGDWLAEHAALRQSAGVLDFSFRSRICLTGADRVRFLHGQVTNDVKKLRVGEGCYAAITTNKGKMESDLNIFCLADELLLDFEPGLTEKVSQRLEKFIVADDVQIVDVALPYGLLSVQGPKADDVVGALGLFTEIPDQPFGSVKVSDATLGEIYLMNQPRLCSYCSSGHESAHSSTRRKSEPTHVGCSMDSKLDGFDLFIPNNSLGAMADKLIAAAKQIGGRPAAGRRLKPRASKQAFRVLARTWTKRTCRSNAASNCRAVSYHKGCYIGQEVINRIHSFGHVNRELRGLRLADDLQNACRNEATNFSTTARKSVTSPAP